MALGAGLGRRGGPGESRAGGGRRAAARLAGAINFQSEKWVWATRVAYLGWNDERGGRRSLSGAAQAVTRVGIRIMGCGHCARAKRLLHEDHLGGAEGGELRVVGGAVLRMTCSEAFVLQGRGPKPGRREGG